MIHTILIKERISDEELAKIIDSLTRRGQSKVSQIGNIVQINLPLKGRIEAERPLQALSRSSNDLLYREVGLYNLTTNGEGNAKEKVETKEMMKALGFYLSDLKREKTKSFVELGDDRKVFLLRNEIDHPDEKSLLMDFYSSYQNAGIFYKYFSKFLVNLSYGFFP